MLDHPSGLSAENDIALQKFGVGQPVRRKEDDTLVRGKGTYTDDINLPGQAYAWIVRSTHAHGLIKRIDIEAAKTMPGVLGVWTGKDLAAYTPFGVGLPLKNRDGSALLQTNRLPLMTDKVRFVGDPVAFVVAETLAQARDAGEAVVVDIEPLPSVTSAEDAAKPGAPLLYDHIPSNVVLDYHSGDDAALDAAFASAAHVTRLDIVNTRLAVVAMEPRAGLASYDRKTQRFTIEVPTQGVAGNRLSLAKTLNVPPEKVHLRTRNVGGSFGMKNTNYPEYICILHAARELGRPSNGPMSVRPAFSPTATAAPRTCIANWHLPPTAHSRRARARLRQSRRLHHRRRTAAAVPQHRQEHQQRLSHAADRRRHQMRADQYDTDGRLSRRGPPRGELFHGATD
jgi:carbon-monoxide dehydrogenase large subunit